MAEMIYLDTYVLQQDMRVGNDTSRAGQPAFFARNRGMACVHPDSKKWLRHFFDSLRE